MAEEGPELESVSVWCSGMDQPPAIAVVVFLEGVLWEQMCVKSESREQHLKSANLRRGDRRQDLLPRVPRQGLLVPPASKGKPSGSLWKQLSHSPGLSKGEENRELCRERPPTRSGLWLTRSWVTRPEVACSSALGRVAALLGSE